MTEHLTPLKDRVCIVGVGETDYSRRSGRSEQTLAMQAIRAALDDAGLDGHEVDAVVPYAHGVPAEDVISNLGMRDVTFVAAAPMGGASAAAGIKLAAVALATGMARYAVTFVARNGASGQRVAARVRALPGQQFRTQLEYPYGWNTPAQWYSIICRRHMHVYGTTKRQMGTVAVTMRRHAQLNPQAMMYGRPLTLDDYFNPQVNDVIADPYHKFDCCLESDGACAVVLTAADRARDLRVEPVYISGMAEGHPESPDDISNRQDWFHIGLSDAAPKAYQMAGVTPADMDAAMIYDCFTFEVLHQLEEAGFCPRGEGGPFVEGGAIGLGGKLPVNPHGGLMSQAHMIGLNHAVEAVRQLRGECGERQVRGARWIAVTGWGDMADGSMLILRGAKA